MNSPVLHWSNADVEVHKIVVGPFENNVFVVRCKSTGDAVLIDAANEHEQLLQMCRELGVRRVLETHGHWDHWQALTAVLEATGASSIAHVADVPMIDATVDSTVDDGSSITIGAVSLRAIHLVGHTPGSIALVYDDPDGPPHLWTGDCLFPGGVGNTEKDPARFASLYNGVVSRLFDQLPDETWVYPGHGRDTTLGAERPHLQEWRDRGW